MKKIVLTIVAALTLGAAQSQSFKPKYSAGIDYGKAKVSDQTTEVAIGLVSVLGGSATTTQSSSISNFRVYGGYDFTENFGAEVGYNNTSNVAYKYSGTAGSTYSNVAYSGAIGLKYTGFDYSALLRPSIASGWNNLFFRVGFHNLEQKASGSVTVSTTTVAYTATQSGSGTLYGVGYDAKISDDLDFRAQYTRMIKIAGESGTYSNMYMVGIKKSF